MKINHYKVPVNQSLKSTMVVMRDLINKTLIDNEFICFVHRTFKTRCGDCVPKIIHSYVVQNFHYKEDVYDEVIQAPYILIKSRTGDCDDFALFIYCALRILGHAPKFIVFGKAPGKFSHIAIMVNGQIVDGTNANYNDYETILKKYNYYLYP